MNALPTVLTEPQPPLPKWRALFGALWSLTWRARTTWGRWPLLAATVFAIPALAFFVFPDPPGASAEPYRIALLSDPQVLAVFLNWTVDFYLLLVVPLYCLAMCGPMIRDELQSDTLVFLITRPLTRARLFLLKFATLLVWIQSVTLANFALLALAGYLRQMPDMAQFFGMLFCAQILAVFAYSALGALFGLITKRYFVLGIVYGFVVEFGIGRIPTNINVLSMSHHIQTLLGNARLIQQVYPWGTEETLLAVLVLVFSPFLLLGAGALLFTVREYHSAEEMQK